MKTRALLHASLTVSFVLAKAEDGADPDTVAARVERETGLKARSSARFSGEIIEWMLKFSGVAEFFGVTILMGVVIGIAIVGQTFYLFSVENVKQFATLKAIGVGNRSVLGMIFLQASVVAVLGFAIGVGVASGVPFLLVVALAVLQHFEFGAPRDGPLGHRHRLALLGQGGGEAIPID